MNDVIPRRLENRTGAVRCDGWRKTDGGGVNKNDRAYQFWKRESLSVELFSPAVFYQKLEYIHNNPVRAGICNFPGEYHYSSASFYATGVDKFGMLSHYM